MLASRCQLDVRLTETPVHDHSFCTDTEGAALAAEGGLAGGLAGVPEAAAGFRPFLGGDYRL